MSVVKGHTSSLRSEGAAPRPTDSLPPSHQTHQAHHALAPSHSSSLSVCSALARWTSYPEKKIIVITENISIAITIRWTSTCRAYALYLCQYDCGYPSPIRLTRYGGPKGCHCKTTPNTLTPNLTEHISLGLDTPIPFPIIPGLGFRRLVNIQKFLKSLL